MRFITMLLHSTVAWVAETLSKYSFQYMQRMGLLLPVAHTSAAFFTDARYYISANLPATYNAAGYGATAVVFTEIDRVESFPPYGEMRPVAEFRPIYGAVEKSKGAPDYGSGDMVCADMPLNAGHIIMKAAATSQNHYSMKAVMPDSEIHYLDVLVLSWQLTPAAEGTFMKRTAQLQFNKAPVIVAAV